MSGSYTTDYAETLQQSSRRYQRYTWLWSSLLLSRVMGSNWFLEHAQTAFGPLNLHARGFLAWYRDKTCSWPAVVQWQRGGAFKPKNLKTLQYYNAQFDPHHICIQNNDTEHVEVVNWGQGRNVIKSTMSCTSGFFTIYGHIVAAVAFFVELLRSLLQSLFLGPLRFLFRRLKT